MSLPDDGDSVRPPDLVPEEVRDLPDVLHGWDTGADAAEVAGWQRDQRPFPLDTVVVVGSATIGLVLGATLSPHARGRGASLGALVGVVSGAVARRIWHLGE
jgi:hypothetical protein